MPPWPVGPQAARNGRSHRVLLCSPPKSARCGGSGLILVVDDEEMVGRTAKAVLRRYGYTVLLAEDGRLALDVFREIADRVRLVLLDLNMPVMGGEEALRQLKLIRPDVRVILSSGYNETEAVRLFTGKGLVGFIQKPYTTAQLAEKIRAALEAA